MTAVSERPTPSTPSTAGTPDAAVAPDAAAAPEPGRLAVRVRGFARAFDGRVVLRDVDLDIREGEFVALLGKSGSGKTTLLRALGGLDGGGTGTVFVPAASTVVFQEPRLVPSRRVWRNVVLGMSGRQTRAIASRALAEVGLDHVEHAWPSTLSGGEAQRVALARALVREPSLLLLDEPFAALDALTRLNMQALVADLCRRHQPAVLLVTHDIDEAILLADRVVVLTDGRIAFDARVTLPRPRPRGSREFLELRQSLLHELGVDTAAEAVESRPV